MFKKAKKLEQEGKIRSYQRGDWGDIEKKLALNWIDQGVVWIPETQCELLIDNDEENVLASADRLLIGVFGKIIYWDGKKTHTVFKTKERVYGITWNSDNIFVAIGLKGKILVFNSRWEKVNVFSCETKMDDVHQIMWWKDTLYVVASKYDTILCYGKQNAKISWRGRFCKINENPHINSIWCDGKRFYVTEHYHDELPKKIRIFDLDWRVLDVFVLGQDVFENEESNGIHNVYIENDILYTLGPGKIIQIDMLNRNIVTHKIKTPWSCYIRGLARTENAFYVGLSKFHSIRLARIEGESAFVVLDNNLLMRKMFTMRNTGQVYEIRALKGDKAHNSIDCPFQG